MDGKWFWDHATKFAWWQHPARRTKQGLLCTRNRRRLPMKSRPVLLDMTATCASADLPSPTHVAGGDGGMTTLNYGVCELMPTDPDWRHTPATVHRPSYGDNRSATSTSTAVDCYGDPASVARTSMWDVIDDDVEFDARVCWAAYHHHMPAAGGDISASGDGRTAISSPTTSSFRPPIRTASTAAAAVVRTHVYEMPPFQS